MRLLVLGASGGVGSRLVQAAVAHGHQVTAQTRAAGRVGEAAAVRVVVGAPDDPDFLKGAVAGQDAVAVCTGIDRLGATTLFSDLTRALVTAMRSEGVQRVVAVTGVGAGDSRGHGGWFYNRILFPLFTRRRYADKDRQESLLRDSGLDWTIVRPAPFAQCVGAGPLRIVTTIPPGLQLSAVTRDEVAGFLLELLETGGFLHETPLVGHEAAAGG